MFHVSEENVKGKEKIKPAPTYLTPSPEIDLNSVAAPAIEEMSSPLLSASLVDEEQYANDSATNSQVITAPALNISKEYADEAEKLLKIINDLRDSLTTYSTGGWRINVALCVALSIIITLIVPFVPFLILSFSIPSDNPIVLYLLCGALFVEMMGIILTTILTSYLHWYLDTTEITSLPADLVDIFKELEFIDETYNFSESTVGSTLTHLTLLSASLSKISREDEPQSAVLAPEERQRAIKCITYAGTSDFFKPSKEPLPGIVEIYFGDSDPDEEREPLLSRIKAP